MTFPLAPRRQPRTTVGKLIRAWSTIRLAVRIARFVARARLALQATVFALALLAVVGLIRRRRHRLAEPASSYAPPPVPTAVPSPAQPVDAEAPTETERRLQAEK